MIARHITTKHGVTLVESLDGADRRALPSRSVARLNGDGCEVDEAEWARGIPQELELSQIVLSVDALRTAFHKRGLWTSADVRARPHDARAALVDACGDAVKRLIEGNSNGQTHHNA